ncbi:transcription factor bHLH144 [Cannabis sativa]|uniref:transcription factor bHLH144 n=1 Tax=Cannabis sativa TaxID=3483 RepID=UPI0029CAA0EE|nr:transcription factor bHLH144 [Cannabis sativa]XP_060957594.1 transcription factor bHLH144 [Cannabis sativa]
MQRNHQFYTEKKPPPLDYQAGNNEMHVPVASGFGAAALPPGGNHLKHFHGVEFQPSEVCPKNFIIFDQTDHRSQIMFHPAIANKFGSPALNMGSACVQGYFGGIDRNNNEVGELSSTLKEDSDDIDALLSLEEEEEEEEYDEEELSTARTYGNYGSSSPESCSNYGTRNKKNRTSSSSVQKSSDSGSSSSNSERKRHRMKKMVKALRGIVPGGNDMTTVTVLDEAVQYLKSLKVEVQKHGVKNFRN